MKEQKIKFINIFLLFILTYNLQPTTYNLFAQDDDKLVVLTKQIIEAKSDEGLFSYFEEAKGLYFNDNNYTGFVEFLKSLFQKKSSLEPFTSYYIALSRYQQLKHLEEEQKWDEYFNNGNAYREELTQSVQKAIDATNAAGALNIYSRLLLWQFHKDQQDAFLEAALSDLMNSVLEYSRSAKEPGPIKVVAERLSRYAEKSKSKEAYRIYVNKIAASEINDNRLKEIALEFYKEQNLESSEAVYDCFMERIIKSLPREKGIQELIDIAKKFSYKEDALGDGFYAEKIFKKIEEIGVKNAFDQELIYLRAFNLEKIKEYAQAKDFYLALAKRFPLSSHVDEADFKAGIIYTYILRDIKTGRAYFEKLSQREKLSPQVALSLYQLGLLSQWENDSVKAKDYYNALMEKIKDDFAETAAMTKERLKEIAELKPIEHNLKTFLDVSLKEGDSAFDGTKLALNSSRYRINTGEITRISSAPYNIESGCMQVEIHYLWSGGIGRAKPSLQESSFDTAYLESGTKVINVVAVSPAGIIDRTIEILDVY